MHPLEKTEYLKYPQHAKSCKIGAKLFASEQSTCKFIKRQKTDDSHF